MSPTRQVPSAILGSLQGVERERARRLADPALAERVVALKSYQQARFAHTYRDLLADGRHAAAARFFLEELYGPHDFTKRDAQFVRIIPAIGRLFPPDIVATVAMLAELHALSESLDTAMSEVLRSPTLDAGLYLHAWQATGRAADRERQISLALSIGEALDRYTRRPVLAASLRLMRGPARAAGLSDLQRFLEAGFDTFKAMRGADDFLQTVGERERAFAAKAFAADPTAQTGSGQFP